MRVTAFLVVMLATQGVIDPETIHETIDAMLAAGWHRVREAYMNSLGG